MATYFSHFLLPQETNMDHCSSVIFQREYSKVDHFLRISSYYHHIFIFLIQTHDSNPCFHSAFPLSFLYIFSFQPIPWVFLSHTLPEPSHITVLPEDKLTDSALRFISFPSRMKDEKEIFTETYEKLVPHCWGSRCSNVTLKVYEVVTGPLAGRDGGQPGDNWGHVKTSGESLPDGLQPHQPEE